MKVSSALHRRVTKPRCAPAAGGGRGGGGGGGGGDTLKKIQGTHGWRQCEDPAPPRQVRDGYPPQLHSRPQQQHLAVRRASEPD